MNTQLEDSKEIGRRIKIVSTGFVNMQKSLCHYVENTHPCQTANTKVLNLMFLLVCGYETWTLKQENAKNEPYRCRSTETNE